MATSTISTTSPSGTAATSSSGTGSSAGTAISTASQIAAQKKAAAQATLKSLGAGSGVDLSTLAQSLVDAEGAPKKAEINAKIQKNDAKISGLSAVMFMMSELKTKLSAIKDRSSFNSTNASSNNETAVTATASNTAQVGNHSIQVASLSQAQKSSSQGFAADTTSLNNGNPFSITINGSNTGVSTGTDFYSSNNASSVSGLSFGTKPSKTDFKNFSVTVDGKTFSITPSPSGTTLAELATDLQSQLRSRDGSDDLSVTLEPGNTIAVRSASASRVVSDAKFSQSATINLDSGASKGTSVDNQIIGAQFGTKPSTSDFSDFSISVDGKTLNLAPVPSQPTLESLAENLQMQLRLLEGTEDLSVSVTNGNLEFRSASGRSIASPALVKTSYSDTPAGLVRAIQASNLGFDASLVNDGSDAPYKILISGAAGANETFTVSSDSATSLNFGIVSAASDTRVSVDGMDYVRKSNTISDIIPGVVLDLKSTTTQAATISIKRNTTDLQTKLNDLVTAYNDFNNIVSETTNPKSTLETYGGTLVGNNIIRMVQMQVRSVVLGKSSTASGGISTLSQLGLSIDQKGVMSLDSAKLDTVINNNFDDIVKTLTGGFDKLGAYSSRPAGIAGDAFRKITQLLGSNGPLVQQSQNATTQNTKLQGDLSKLEVRLSSLLERYTKQFASMDSLVGSINSQKTSLKSTFDGMMAMYTNK